MTTPRRVRRKPFVQIAAPLAWTTLALTIRADGSHEHQVVGASPFPRHWIYDGSGTLVAKTGLIDFKDWYRKAFGRQTPWGGRDAPALVTEVESPLEREVSRVIMRGGAKPEIRRIKRGAILGERALLEGGVRTSTLRAVTPCKVAAARGDQIDPTVLADVARGHRREGER